MKRGGPKNSIAVHAHESNHTIDWDGARVKRSDMTGYWQRRTTEAIHIKQSEKTMNLDGGLQLLTIWNPVLNLPLPTLGLSRVCLSKPMPPHPMIIIYYLLSIFIIPQYYYYSRPVTCYFIKHSCPSYDVMIAVYIRPNHLFSSAL